MPGAISKDALHCPLFSDKFVRSFQSSHSPETWTEVAIPDQEKLVVVERCRIGSESADANIGRVAVRSKKTSNTAFRIELTPLERGCLLYQLFRQYVCIRNRVQIHFQDYCTHLGERHVAGFLLYSLSLFDLPVSSPRFDHG